MAADTATRLREELEKDRRNVSDLWVAAVNKYQGIMGFQLERKPEYNSIQSIVAAGASEMNKFHKWRHNRGKVDRLRTLFSENLEFIQQGSQQILCAASASFPPAIAIGTALTYLLGVSYAFSFFLFFLCCDVPGRYLTTHDGYRRVESNQPTMISSRPSSRTCTAS